MLICRVRYPCPARHRVSSLILRSLSSSPDSTPIQRHEILTLLHKTTSLLPRALASTEQGAPVAESLDLWKEILSKSYDDLVAKGSRPARVVVYGIDQWSGAEDLVTSLLEEPLISDQSMNERLRKRWKERPGQARLTLSPLPSENDSEVHLPSSFFDQFLVPLQIIELHPTSSVASSVFDTQTSDTLLKADIALILCNPITTPISTLLRDRLLSRNPNTILVVTSTPSKSAAEALKNSVLDHIPDKLSRKLHVLFVDPSRAVAANEALKADFQSPTAVQRYQDEYVGSQVSTVISMLKSILSPQATNPHGSSFRTQAALAQIEAALSTCRVILHRARNEMDSVAVDVCTLKARLEEAKARGPREVFSFPQSSRAEVDAVVDSVNIAAQEVKVVMDRLTWWRMVWRVDEISTLVTQAMSQPGCRKLEQRLILQTGRLSMLQDEITKSMFDLLAAHPTPPFNSAILQNTLRQLMASPFRVTPHNLTHPIDTRRRQIIEHPTTRLHVAAQRATLGMSGGLATGAGLGWAGWVGWLSGTGEGLLGTLGLDAGTAMGLGLLTAAASVRWAVGKWERAKRRWWEDWDRVGDGLARDLKATLDKTMDNKVLLVAETGCDKLSELIAQRRSQVEEVEEAIDALEAKLDSLRHPSQ
ncbi:hypothetical protein H0H92_011635 [Tricholoma furcatifolium]|nr:hypothetical protein H0H92_011635 [Tricholoma furcatifolium]